MIKNKITPILLNAVPIIIMMGFIPLVINDYMLALIYIVLIVIALVIKREVRDLSIFTFGFFVMIIAETIFISTGVETFTRNSLFGLMPLWLPFLWGYSFVAIKRGIKILEL